MKRLFDFLMSLIAIIILSPVILIVALAVKFTSPGPILFKQRRIGKDNIEFEIYKFRTMRVDTPNVPTHLLENPKQWITPIGKFLRKTSLDELPQLFNILKGDMSFVGPRPPIPREVELYTAYQLQRLSVKPGLTCYWQVSGRNNIDFDEWVELDLKYIKERNTWIDIKLILLTIPALLGDKNAS